MSVRKAASPTRRERVAQKERALLDAARTVFVARGYDGARITEIARLAGISEGSVYSYYKAKSDLMQAVLAEFWDDLTAGARAATAGTGDSFAALRALAAYHLDGVIENFDFVNLTFALRRDRAELAGSRAQLRRYVAVFDEIFRRGQDRGEIDAGAELRLVRDSFYGTLEYAARTLVQRRTRRPGDADAVVENLVGQIRARHGAPAPAPRAAADPLIARLQEIAEQLDATLVRARDGGRRKS
jgi:AcrR family transcriptional regulator